MRHPEGVRFGVQFGYTVHPLCNPHDYTRVEALDFNPEEFYIGHDSSLKWKTTFLDASNLAK